MLRVANQCEKNIAAVPALLVPVVVNTPVDALPDHTKSSPAFSVKELCGRFIQNVGANPVYYCFGQDCLVGGNYHGILSSLQQLDCSNHCMRVSVLCTTVGGTTIAPTILRRVDLDTHTNILQPA